MSECKIHRPPGWSLDNWGTGPRSRRGLPAQTHPASLPVWHLASSCAMGANPLLPQMLRRTHPGRGLCRPQPQASGLGVSGTLIPEERSRKSENMVTDGCVPGSHSKDVFSEGEVAAGRDAVQVRTRALMARPKQALNIALAPWASAHEHRFLMSVLHKAQLFHRCWPSSAVMNLTWP